MCNKFILYALSKLAFNCRLTPKGVKLTKYM